MLRRKKAVKGNYAFIDNQNLNVSTQKFGWKMDWRKFRQFLKKEYGVTKAYMFIGYVPEFEEMYTTLNEFGYGIVLKPTTTGSAPTGENGEKIESKKPVKGNVDADLVLWAMKEIDNYDQAVLVTGDGDFFGLAEYLNEKEKLLKILVPSMHYSRLFKPFGKYIERLDYHRQELRYPDRVRKNGKRPVKK